MRDDRGGKIEEERRAIRDRDGRLRGVMQASIAMSQWRFSSDRMLEEYFARVYRS